MSNYENAGELQGRKQSMNMDNEITSSQPVARGASITAGALAAGGLLFSATRAFAEAAATPEGGTTTEGGTAGASGTGAVGSEPMGAEPDTSGATPTDESGTTTDPGATTTDPGAMATDPSMTATDPSMATSSPSMMGAMETDAPSDVEILNLALGLEYLLHDLYRRAADANTNGYVITETSSATTAGDASVAGGASSPMVPPGILSSGPRPYLRGRMSELITALRDDEAAHIVGITNAISEMGGIPATRTAFNFPVDVFVSPIAFAEFAYKMEETAIGAYLGAVGNIRSREVRASAAGLYGSATRHAALLRHLGGFDFAPRYFESPLTMAQVAAITAPFVA